MKLFQSIQIFTVLSLGLIGQTVALADTSTSWLDDLNSQIQNTPEIHFDAVLTGVMSSKILPPLEVKGTVARSGEADISLMQAGHIGCHIISDGNSAMAYCPLTNRFITFDPAESLSPAKLAEPDTFAKTRLGRYLVDQVTIYGELTTNFVLLAVKDPKTLVLSFNSVLSNSSIAWTVSEKSDNGSSIEHVTGSGSGSHDGSSANETLVVDYRKSPLSLRRIGFDVTSENKSDDGSMLVTFQQCDIAPANTKSQASQFQVVIPGDAVRWTPSQPR